MNFTAGSARASIAHSPEVFLKSWDAHYAVISDAFTQPLATRLFVYTELRAVRELNTTENCDVEFFLGNFEPVGRGDQFPSVRNRILLEIIAKRKIAEHLEKRVMPLRKPHIFQVVVLPARAHAFLRRRRPRVIPLLQPQKHVLELVHPRIRKQQGSVPMRHQRRAPHPPVPLAFKKLQKFLPNFVPRQGRLSFAGFNPQIIADAANPRNEAPVAQASACADQSLDESLPQDTYSLIPAHVIDIEAKLSHPRGHP